MNFYLFLSAFLVVSLGHWATAKDVFFHLRKPSTGEGPPEETKKRLGGEGEAPLMDGLGRVAARTRAWAQWVRRVLKALRKWSHSHPPEVKLGKCFARYFNVKLPGVRRFEVAHRNDDSKVSKKRRITRKTTKKSERSSPKGNFFWRNILLPVQDFLRDIKATLSHYTALLYRNDLALCAWEYFLKKFWMWVDSAPDPRLCTFTN